jgi:hypothetical protein
MAHFAQIDENNLVINVIVVSDEDTSDNNGVKSGSIGVAFCQKLLGANTNWKQTSYNNNIRGNYAGIGYTYMTNVATLGVGSTDIFISQQPYASWTIDTTAAQWKAPITQPTLTDEDIAANKLYEWNESAYQGDNSKGWDLKTIE